MEPWLPTLEDGQDTQIPETNWINKCLELRIRRG